MFKIFQQVMVNKDLRSTEKYKVLEVYKVITKTYELKETGFFTKFSGAAIEKEKQIQHADPLISKGRSFY